MGDRRDRFTWQEADVEVHQPPPSGPQERRPRRVPGAESDSGLPSPALPPENGGCRVIEPVPRSK